VLIGCCGQKGGNAMSRVSMRPIGYWRRRVAFGRCSGGDGFFAVTVLNLSESPLQPTRRGLAAGADQVEGVIADATMWEPRQVYELWHDRAAFHFLTDERDRAAYIARLRHAIIATVQRSARCAATMPKVSAGRSGAPSSLSKPAATNIRPLGARCSPSVQPIPSQTQLGRITACHRLRLSSSMRPMTGMGARLDVSSLFQA
jgi:hypothetical protein